MRRVNDAYYTPAWAVDELLEVVGISKTAEILEPCSGDGAIANRLTAQGYHTVLTNDIDLNVQADTHYDYLSKDFEAGWIITNPPFNLAFAFLLKAMGEARVGAAMLLRLSFLEPTEQRGHWLAANPPNVLIVMPRISFTGNGKTDSVTTAWLIWRHGDRTQKTIIVPKRDRV